MGLTKKEQEIFDLIDNTFNNYWYSTTNLVKQRLAKDIAKLFKEEYEPYFGWCDVDGCENEGCSGGTAWRNKGYWTVCTKHAQDNRDGKPQPKMKKSAIERENSRDKNGYLP